MPEDLGKSLLETIQIQNETISELRLVVEQSRREVTRLARRLAELTAATRDAEPECLSRNSEAPTFGANSHSADIRPIEEQIMAVLKAAHHPLKGTVIAAKLKRRPTSFFWEALWTLSAAGLIEKTIDKHYQLSASPYIKPSSSVEESRSSND